MISLVCPPVLQKGLCPLARQLCKTGCLVGHRRALWCAAMGVDPDLPQVWMCVCVGRGIKYLYVHVICTYMQVLSHTLPLQWLIFVVSCAHTHTHTHTHIHTHTHTHTHSMRFILRSSSPLCSNTISSLRDLW